MANDDEPKEEKRKDLQSQLEEAMRMLEKDKDSKKRGEPKDTDPESATASTKNNGDK